MLRTNFLGDECSTDCVGCSIANGEMIIPGGILHESEFFLLHQDPETPIEGFFVITSKRHFKQLHEMTEIEAIHLSKMIHIAMNHLKILNPCILYTLIFEERSKHFHVWIFPRLKWMETYENSISTIREIMKISRLEANEEKKQSVMSFTDEFRKTLQLH